MIGASLDEQMRVNDLCRAVPVRTPAFIAADIAGVFSYAFNDFGGVWEEVPGGPPVLRFSATDKNGEAPISCQVGSITTVSCSAASCCLDANWP